MNRAAIKRKTHCQEERLTTRDPLYLRWLKKSTVIEMNDDVGKGDITTGAFFNKNQKSNAIVIAKGNGILAGEQEIACFLGKNRKLKFVFKKHDGDVLKKGDTVMRLSGNIYDLMKVERIVLNLIGRMSGIATYTKKIVGIAKKKNPEILITPTRKTLWGWLDKRACVVGGGGTHRLSLDNAILIKHNHLKASKTTLENFLKKVLANAKGKFVEIEVKNAGEALYAAKIFTEAVKNGFKLPCFIMLDNVSPEEISKAISKMKKTKFYDSVILEASGNINEKNIARYAKTGVDILSLGAITHSAPMLDFSMRIV